MKSANALIGIATAASFLAGCNGAPHSETLPYPAPLNASRPSPTFEACGDLTGAQFLAYAPDAQTVRNGETCVAVYEMFNHRRIGSLAAGSAFGVLCRDLQSGGWEVRYGENYGKSGAVYLTNEYQVLFDAAVASGQANAIPSCGNRPHMPIMS